MQLTKEQLQRFTEIFEIKAKSIIMIDKGVEVTIIFDGEKIFNVKRDLVKEFF